MYIFTQWIYPMYILSLYIYSMIQYSLAIWVIFFANVYLYNVFFQLFFSQLLCQCVKMPNKNNFSKFTWGSWLQRSQFIDQLQCSEPKVRQHVITDEPNGGKVSQCMVRQKGTQEEHSPISRSKAHPKWSTSFSHAPSANSYHPVSPFKLEGTD